MSINEQLKHIPIEIKAKVFDALVKEFQFSPKIIGKKLVTKSYRQYTYGAECEVEEVPTYMWELKADGNSDFCSAILKLVKE